MDEAFPAALLHIRVPNRRPPPRPEARQALERPKRPNAPPKAKGFEVMLNLGALREIAFAQFTVEFGVVVRIRSFCCGNQLSARSAV